MDTKLRRFMHVHSNLSVIDAYDTYVHISNIDHIHRCIYRYMHTT